MTSTEQAILEQFRALLLERIEPILIRVFGSRARGNAETDSDMDVLVVVEKLDAQTDRFISDCAWEAGFDQGIILSPLVYSRSVYERESLSPLVRAITMEGESL
jgi:hypothetical protein